MMVESEMQNAGQTSERIASCKSECKKKNLECESCTEFLSATSGFINLDLCIINL